MTKTDIKVVVHEGGPPEGGTYGKPPIVVDESYDCPECGKVHLLEACAECGSNDIHYDFGLGGGPGYGFYKQCLDCGHSYKEMLPHDQE